MAARRPPRISDPGEVLNDMNPTPEDVRFSLGYNTQGSSARIGSHCASAAIHPFLTNFGPESAARYIRNAFNKEKSTEVPSGEQEDEILPGRRNQARSGFQRGSRLGYQTVFFNDSSGEDDEEEPVDSALASGGRRKTMLRQSDDEDNDDGGAKDPSGTRECALRAKRASPGRETVAYRNSKMAQPSSMLSLSIHQERKLRRNVPDTDVSSQGLLHSDGLCHSRHSQSPEREVETGKTIAPPVVSPRTKCRRCKTVCVCAKETALLARGEAWQSPSPIGNGGLRSSPTRIGPGKAPRGSLGSKSKLQARGKSFADENRVLSPSRSHTNRDLNRSRDFQEHASEKRRSWRLGEDFESSDEELKMRSPAHCHDGRPSPSVPVKPRFWRSERLSRWLNVDSGESIDASNSPSLSTRTPDSPKGTNRKIARALDGISEDFSAGRFGNAGNDPMGLRPRGDKSIRPRDRRPQPIADDKGIYGLRSIRSSFEDSDDDGYELVVRRRRRVRKRDSNEPPATEQGNVVARRNTGLVERDDGSVEIGPILNTNDHWALGASKQTRQTQTTPTNQYCSQEFDFQQIIPQRLPKDFLKGPSKLQKSAKLRQTQLTSQALYPGLRPFTSWIERRDSGKVSLPFTVNI